MSPRESLIEQIVGRIFQRDAALVVVTLVAVVGLAVYAQSTMDEHLTRKVDAGVVPVARRVDELDAAFKAHAVESQQVHAEIRDDLHELQQDVRALYRAVQTGQPQPRLERPVDGGAP